MGCNLYGATTLSDNSTDGSYAQAPCRKLLNSFPRTFAFQPTHYRPWCRNGLFTQCMRNTCIWAETNLAPIPVVCTCQLQFVFAFSYSLYQPSNFPLVTIQSYCYRYYICPSWLYTFFSYPKSKKMASTTIRILPRRAGSEPLDITVGGWLTEDLRILPVFFLYCCSCVHLTVK